MINNLSFVLISFLYLIVIDCFYKLKNVDCFVLVLKKTPKLSVAFIH